MNFKPKHLLAQLLKKKGIQGIDNLSQEEQETFRRWDKILSEGEVTVDKIAQFCGAQRKMIEGQLKDMTNTTQKNDRLIIYFNVYGALEEVIRAPKAERENLEKYLQQLIDEK